MRAPLLVLTLLACAAAAVSGQVCLAPSLIFNLAHMSKLWGNPIAPRPYHIAPKYDAVGAGIGPESAASLSVPMLGPAALTQNAVRVACIFRLAASLTRIMILYSTDVVSVCVEHGQVSEYR